MPFDAEDFSTEVPLGQVLRLPCKFIEGKSNFTSKQVDNIAQFLKKSGKNLFPVVVKTKGDDTYEATLNIQILEAAKKAGIRYVWCIVVDDEMLTQVQAEAGLVAKTSKARQSKTPKPVAEPKDKALKDMTVKDLKEMAKQRKIAGYSKMKKPELVKALS